MQVNILCPDDRETYVPVTINIDDIKVSKDEEHTNQIKLDDKLMMEMKYPSLEQFVKNNFDFTQSDAVEQSFGLIASCIDKIYNDEDVWATATTKKEVTEFLDQMNTNSSKRLKIL